MGLQFTIYGALLLVGTACYLAYSLFATITAHRRKPLGATRHRYDWYKWAFTALMCMYPLGNGFKFMVFGPEAIRFHLSDVGFPVFLAWTLSQITQRRLRCMSDRISVTEQRFAPVFMHRFLPLALVLSYGYEAFVGYAHATSSGRLDDNPIGSFDWWDMLSYTVGAGLAYAIMRKRLITAQLMGVEYEAHFAMQRELIASVASPAPRRKPKQQYTRTKRRGGRI